MRFIWSALGSPSGLSNFVACIYYNITYMCMIYFSRPDYARLTRLSSLFPGVPLMALTATAPPTVRDQVLKVVPRPVIAQSSVNQPNITYRVVEQTSTGKSKGKCIDSISTVSCHAPVYYITVAFKMLVVSLPVRERRKAEDDCQPAVATNRAEESHHLSRFCQRHRPFSYSSARG